ncbi:rRNA-processing protein bfr2 [Malassezia caprae]|uniref:Protein BFR2 n=1 Tax=Malassezia caprae TaxID=1381934 RepID=A0AAF0E379_9BASI|nr:rRNA-processing protein bfr2 [Malassezia caprae]
MARLNLDELLKVAPESMCSELTSAVDPDNEYDAPPSSSDGESTSDGEADEVNSRRHYVDVGPSEMRRRARLTESDKLEQPKYKGTRVSRRDMFEDELDSEEDSMSDAQDEEDYEDAEEEEVGNEEDEDENEGEDEDEDEDEGEEDEGEDAQDDEEEEEKDRVQERPSRRSSADKNHAPHASSEVQALPYTAATLASQEQESRTLMQQLQERRTQDAKKGRHVQKQIRNWEKALRLRIALQKVISAIARLPPPNMMTDYIAAAPGTEEDVDASAAELEDMAQTLLNVRLHLWKQNIPALADELDSVNTEASSAKALFDLEACIEPQRRTLLSRWSSKIAAAPDSRSASASSRLQLRAMNQSVVEQMDQALAGDGMDRLVDRTRVWRGDETARLGVSQPVSETESRPTDVNVFDDSDFYAQLLRDLIDNASIVEAGISATASDVLQSRKRKRNVDVRASKGRRIRYEVIEKVQNFMPPIPRVTWDDTQAERLFARLASVVPQGKAAEPPADEDVPIDDEFRLLG